jgi:selenocysteine-specific translation elongation factor
MNRIVAVPLDPALASLIGKKGNETSMTFYNRKTGTDIIVGLAPSDMEGKFYALPNSLILAEQIIISTASVDAQFGEVVVAASLLGKRVIFTADNDVSKIVGGLAMPECSFMEREALLGAITSYPQKKRQGSVKVEIDRSFNVKGVGTVLLGFVTRGVLNRHDLLYTGAGKEAVVRSIQCQDEDVEHAQLYARVGIAARGINEDDVVKGDVLSTEKIGAKITLDVDLTQSTVAREPLGQGSQYMIFSGFGSGSCIIESISGQSAKLKLDKGFQLEAGDRVLLGRNKQPRIFASGIVK